MSIIKITGPDGKTEKMEGSYNEETRTVTSYFGRKKIQLSQNDRVEVSECFVATEVYGGLNKPEVKILREFRDQIILPSGLWGTLFVKTYYKVGPYLAKVVRIFKWIRPIVREQLDKVVKRCEMKIRKSNP